MKVLLVIAIGIVIVVGLAGLGFVAIASAVADLTNFDEWS